MNLCRGSGVVHLEPALTLFSLSPRARKELRCPCRLPPTPAWVADLDAALDPSREAILDTPVIVHASENELVDGKIQNFLVAFYPIIRDFPQWLQLLLDRSPEDGKVFFRDNIRVEKRHDAMWRAMGDGFNVPKERFQVPEPMIPDVKEFHAYLKPLLRDVKA